MAEGSESSTYPLAPPTLEETRLAWLRLIRSRRVGPTTFFRLMREHGEADAALDALPAIARTAGVDSYAPCPREEAEREIAAGHAAGARLLAWGEAEYPQALTELGDPPPLLWVRGNLDLLARPMIALVGARNASSLGTRMARRLAEGLGEAGIGVVSGLARGIDTAAHRAALDTGTVDVQAGGVDVVYPPENAVLAAEIAEKGLRLSEQPMGVQPQARHFPLRNRIISGLSRAVIVVEAAARSGSLITARTALDQGREVFSVPGHPVDSRSAGCNMLIRDGATLVRNVEDVLEAVGPLQAPVRAPRTRLTHPRRAEQTPSAEPPSPDAVDRHAAHSRMAGETSALHEQILARLSPSPLAEDQLLRDLALPAGTVAPELLTLELDGRVVRHPGGLLARAS